MNNHDAETLQAVPVKRSRDREEADEAVPATRSRDREETVEAFPVTRSRVRADTTITTPAANRQPIPSLQDVSLWIGHQLNHKRMPKEYRNLPPDGELISSMKGHPEGLLAVPSEEASPRIIVPRSQIIALVLQTHEDIHHQSRHTLNYFTFSSHYSTGQG
jgi:hypothetical protein